MNITLIYPLLSRKRSTVDENKQYWPPLGLAYIASVLEKGGHKVQIIDRDVLLRKNALNFNAVDLRTMEAIESFNSDVVGISATTPNIPDVFHLAKIIKTADPDRMIVLGGTHGSGEPQLTLTECPEIDIVVRGEGEFTMLDIVEKRPLESIDGISYRKESAIVATPDRRLLQDIDALPLPARHLLDMDFYTRPSRFTSRNLSLRTTSIFTARGCPYRCTFCAGPLVFSGRVRFHSKERVIEEIGKLVDRYGIEGLYFAEDMFLSSMKRAREILTLFMSKGLHKKLKWFAQVKAGLATEELLLLMKEAGCVGVEFGFESGSQAVLDRMNKRIRVEENIRAARMAKKAGIRFQGNIIVGFPGETEEDFNKTLDFLWKTKPNSIGFNIFMPLPGTPAYEDIKRDGAGLPRREDIGDPEAPQVNFADMPKEKFEQLYLKARFKIILPINLYYFLKDNIRHPLRMLFVLFTQFKGVFIKSFRAAARLTRYAIRDTRYDKTVLYLSYNGLLEPILPSQGIPYLRELHKRRNIRFVLLTWEKGYDIAERGKEAVAKLKDRLKEEGITWYNLRYHKTPKHLSTVYDLIAGLLFCLYLIPKYGIRIIHTRGITPGIIPLLFSRLCGVKLLYDMRGLLAEEYVGGGLWKEESAAFNVVKWAERSLLRVSDAVVVLTRKHYRLNRNLDFLKSKSLPMEVVPCCVDTRNFSYDILKTSGNNGKGLAGTLKLRTDFVLLYPGKLGTFYFVDEMLDFFKELLISAPGAVFLIVTKDDPSSLLIAAEKKGIPEDAIRITSSSYDDMPKFMRLADAGIFFINPYKKIGSSPIKMGEFLASGVPVIINPGVGDTEALVKDNRVGVVVERFDKAHFRMAIEELAVLRKESEALRARCRRTALEYLSLEKGVERYGHIYEHLLNSIHEA